MFEGELKDPDETDLSFTVVNHPVFTLPRTGGGGFAAAGVAACLAAMSAGLVIRTLLADRSAKRRARRTGK